MLFTFPLVYHLLTSGPFPVSGTISTSSVEHYELLYSMIFTDFMVMVYSLSKAYDIILSPQPPFF